VTAAARVEAVPPASSLRRRDQSAGSWNGTATRLCLPKLQAACDEGLRKPEAAEGRRRAKLLAGKRPGRRISGCIPQVHCKICRQLYRWETVPLLWRGCRGFSGLYPLACHAVPVHAPATAAIVKATAVYQAACVRRQRRGSCEEGGRGKACSRWLRDCAWLQIRSGCQTYRRWENLEKSEGKKRRKSTCGDDLFSLSAQVS